MELSNPKRPRIQLSFRKKLFFSVVTTIAFFAVLEGLLTLVGVQPATHTDDPFVGFSGLLPLFETNTDENGVQFVSTAQNKLHWFNAQSFPRIKKPNTKRIFCMGGSTTYGHPYSDSTSFSGWLREILPVVDSSHHWEVINAGGISYASYRVAALMEELTKYEPDIFVVYSVHNEFLERRTYQNMFEKSKLNLYSDALLEQTRTWALTDRILKHSRNSPTRKVQEDPSSPKIDQLREEVDEILNHTIGPVDYHRDEVWRAQVLRHYESNLKRMVAIAKKAGAKIVFVTPAANEKNCSPFKSEHERGLTDSQYLQLKEWSNQAHAASNVGDVEATLGFLERALQMDPHYADYHYRVGHCYLAQKDYSEALKSFSRAINDDVCPLRAVDEIGHAIQSVVHESGVPKVDFEKKLRRLCELEFGHTILGEEFFLDHVHPTIDVNRRLALWIIEELQAEGIIQGKGIHDRTLADRLKAVETRVLAGIDKRTQAFALRNLAKVLHWAGKFDEAAPRARDVLELLPADPESHFILADCFRNTGLKDAALSEYEKLFANGDFPRAYQPYGELLAEAGQLDQAKAYLLLAILNYPKKAGAYYFLGLVHLRLKEFDLAAESLEESNRLYPDDAETLFNLALAYAGLENHTKANLLFEKVLSKGVRVADVHYQYGLSLKNADQLSDAARQFESAIQIAPEWDSPRLQLEMIRVGN